MELRELLKKLRKERNMSYQDMADKTGYSRSYISEVEKGKSASKKLIEKYIKIFPANKNDILIAYANEKVPDTVIERSEIKTRKIRTYNFLSSGNGCVDLSNYTEVDYMLLNDTYIQILRNGYAFKVSGKYMEPFFLNGDTILFLKKELNTWEELDSKLLLLNLDKDMYIKKLFFEKGIPYLHTFNERIYPPEKLDNFKKIELIGILQKRLEQDLSDYSF